MIITGTPTKDGIATEVAMDNGDTSSGDDEQHCQTGDMENEPD